MTQHLGSLDVGIALAVFFVYLLGMLALGFWARTMERGKTLSDFFVANKALSSVLTMGTYVATLYSAFTFLGATGQYYTEGIGFNTLVLGEIAILGLLMPTVGYKVWRLSREADYVTPTDVIADRYENDRFIRVVYGLANIGFFYILMAIQLVGISYVLQGITGGVLSYRLALLITAGVTGLYVYLGGMRAVAITDLVQMILLTVCLVATFGTVFMFYSVGEFMRGALASVPKWFSAPGPANKYPLSMWLTQLVGFGVGMFFWPHLFVRLYVPRDKKGIYASGMGMMIAQMLLLGTCTLCLGALARYVWPTPEVLGVKPDQIVIKYLMEHFPVWLVALLLTGATAAAMSTFDSQVLVLSSVLLKDVLGGLGVGLKEEQAYRIGRMLTLLLTAVAVIIALWPPQLIVGAVMKISYPGFCGLAPVAILGLYWKRANRVGARVGMVVGLLAAVVVMNWWTNPFGWNWYSGFWALIAGAVATVVASLCTPPSPKETLRKFGLA